MLKGIQYPEFVLQHEHRSVWTDIYGRVDRTETLEPVTSNSIGKFKLRQFKEADMPAIE